MAIPSAGPPTDPQASPRESRGRRHLRGLGAFRPFPSWLSVLAALIAGALILMLLR